MSKTLTKEEQLQLELNFEKQNGLSKEEAILVRESQLISQKQEILQLQIQILTLQNEKKKSEVQEKKAEKEKLKAKNRDYTKVIADKYELDEGWGFNPDTGELI